MCRIMTSNYINCISENGISISIDKGKKVGYSGRSLPMFSPTREITSKDLEDIKKYVEEYYLNVLSKLDPNEVLSIIPNESILLCYEKNDEICHRHLVAYWFELFLGMTTAEVIENPARETFRKVERPEYLKPILENVIKENYEMNGFDDIKDAYMHNKSIQNETPIKKLIYKK